MTFDNPYWDAVKGHVAPDSLRATPVVGEFRLDRSVEESMAVFPNRQKLVRKYCWTIPDPDTVAFVARHAHGGLVDPLAGTGYWAYLLTQAGVDVVCYDLNPAVALLTNGWHDEDLYAEVHQKDCAEAAALHPDRTLLLSWPPHGQDVGARTLTSYGGNRVIVIGDGRGCGDSEMHGLLDAAWIKVDDRRPVQWWGIDDRVTVYERDGGRSPKSQARQSISPWGTDSQPSGAAAQDRHAAAISSRCAGVASPRLSISRATPEFTIRSAHIAPHHPRAAGVA